MQDVKAARLMEPANSKKFFLILFLLAFLAAIGLYANNVYKAFQATSAPSQIITTISQASLEEKYGLRVNLVAVTAAGGLVDVRLKIVDGAKARTLLGDKNNFPVLVLDNNATLHPSGDIASQEIQFDNDTQLVILFSNAGNTVKPGSPVAIKFGDIALEPVISK